MKHSTTLVGIRSARRHSGGPHNVPWGHGVRPDVITGIPTLVITGGWNDEYETIAGALARHGARHVVLKGATHRPQDLLGFAAAVDEFTHVLSSTAE